MKGCCMILVLWRKKFYSQLFRSLLSFRLKKKQVLNTEFLFSVETFLWFAGKWQIPFQLELPEPHGIWETEGNYCTFTVPQDF